MTASATDFAACAAACGAVAPERDPSRRIVACGMLCAATAAMLEAPTLDPTLLSTLGQAVVAFTREVIEQLDPDVSMLGDVAGADGPADDDLAEVFRAARSAYDAARTLLADLDDPATSGAAASPPR